jgi:fatty-acyl-CoA synthase
LAGGRVVLREGFNAAEAIALMSKHQASTYVTVTSTAVLTLKAAQLAGETPIKSLRKLLVGGSPIPPAMIAEWKELVPEIDVYAIYGLTEMSPSTSRLHGGEVLRKPGSVGRPYDGIEIRVTDETGADVPAGTRGEICLRSPTMMKEYYRNPEATAAALAAGWLHTGDIGYVDDDGCLYIVDRKKNVIKRGGVTIYPAEVEAALYGHPAVKEVVVIGLSDPVMGEIVTAVIAARSGMEFTAAEVVAHCRDLLAGFKIPGFVVFLDELPKNGTGKVAIRQIRDALELDRSGVIDCRAMRPGPGGAGGERPGFSG